MVRISFDSGTHRTPGSLNGYIRAIFGEHAKKPAVDLPVRNESALLFRELIQTAFKRHRERVVVLVNKYDKPILDNLETAEITVAMREDLKSLYSVLKDCDPYLADGFGPCLSGWLPSDQEEFVC